MNDFMWILPLAIAIAALLGAAMAIVQAKRSVRDAQQQEQALIQRIERLESELSAMMDGAFGVASQLQKVESNLKNTTQQQEQLQQRDRGNLPYNDAVRRVSKGAGVDELVEHCGLSRSEAELVKMLHKKSAPGSEDDELASLEPVEVPQPTRERIIEEPTPLDEMGLAPVVTDEPESEPEPSFEQQNDMNKPLHKPDSLTEASDNELPLSENDEPLFSGELGGEDFQQALERARELQRQQETSETKDESIAEEPQAPAKPQNRNDE